MQATKSKEKIVNEVLKEAGIHYTVDAKRADVKIGYVWEVMLRSRIGKPPFFFRYTTKGEQPPTVEELFTHLTKSDPGNLYEWCRLLGYNPDSRTDKREYDQQLREFKNMERLFTPEQLNELRQLDLLT